MNQVVHPLPDAHDVRVLDDFVELARRIRIDGATGDLVIENGAARLILKRDGTIRVEGRRIVGMADDAITLKAAYIDLN